jgi:hypothetical protein
LATVSDAGPAPTSATFLPVLLRGRLGDQVRDVVAVVGGDALQAADGHGLAVHAGAAAGGLAGAIARAPEDAGNTFDSRFTM